ncbi:hypothetical protein Taro_009704 [Colocasia esculenta]|uniref:Uncharacterized protein n=1 Tax=Colocasia esculenta TaxID=4460 RepID=A0A843U5K0_COLES|nr:hypothetical protein [Colocasia esculenta]
MNASALLDVIPGTTFVTRGMGFRLASNRGDAFKGFKRGVCPGCDFDQSVKSFISARQSRGCSVWRRGGCCGAFHGGFRRFRLPAVHAAREAREDDARSMGVPSARMFWRLLVGLHGMSVGKVGFGLCSSPCCVWKRGKLPRRIHVNASLCMDVIWGSGPMGWLEGHRVTDDKPFLALVYLGLYIKVGLSRYQSTVKVCVVFLDTLLFALVVGGQTPVVNTGPRLVLFQCQTLGFSAGAPKGVKLGPASYRCFQWDPLGLRSISVLVVSLWVSSVGRLCQPICTSGSVSGIAAEEGDVIMNASALLDAIPGTAFVTCGTSFHLASDRGDAFKGFKRGVCLGRNFDQSVKSFISARQSRGCSVRRTGGCCGAFHGGFRRFRLPAVRAAQEPCEDDAWSVGMPSARRSRCTLVRVATGSIEIATGACTGRDRLSLVGQQIAMTGSVAMALVNAAYRAVAFTGGSIPPSPMILQNPTLLDSMADSGSSDSVGGYSVAFLSADQQERYSAVKTKLCGNKAVDLADLEKHGMHSVVEALQRLKWTGICSVSEPIGHSLVESVDIHAKGLGIIGTEYKLKDGKIDINQFNAFNRILHFIVCQILVPRSAPFSSCTKGDADMMFWAVQKQEINMAQVIIERMKSAAEAIWDRKNKLAVSLPYAHLLTRIFSHLDIYLKGELMEKMGQPIRSRNLKKSGFSLIGNVWTKISVVESEAIIGEVPEDPQVQEEEVALREEEPPAPERRIEDIASEHIEPIGQSTEEIVPPTVPAPAIVEEVIAEGVAHFEGELEDIHIEETPNVPEVETTLKESHEHTVSEEPEIQREPTASAPTDQFQEGLVESTSDDNVEPTVGSRGRGKGVAPKVPLLTRKAHHRSRKKKIHAHMKLVIARLNAHGEILCSLQSDISSIFISQSTGAKEIGAVKYELQEMRSELGSLKKLVTNLSDFVRVQLSAPVPPAPTQSMPEVSARPPGPSESVELVARPSGTFVDEVRPSGSSVAESGPPGPSLEESGPSGPSVQMESVAGPTGPQVSVQEVVVPPGPSKSPNLQTPAPSSPPTSFTAPPAPETFKKPLRKHISSPTPFPAASSSSPISSSSIPPTTSEAPLASSSSASPSSAGASSQPPPTSSFGSLHPPTPPSFITIIPEAASVIPHFVHDIKDEFEEAILRTVLVVSAHIHRTDSQPSSGHASKKRKTSSALVFPSNQTLFPPM